MYKLQSTFSSRSHINYINKTTTVSNILDKIFFFFCCHHLHFIIISLWSLFPILIAIMIIIQYVFYIDDFLSSSTNSPPHQIHICLFIVPHCSTSLIFALAFLVKDILFTIFALYTVRKNWCLFCYRIKST